MAKMIVVDISKGYVSRLIKTLELNRLATVDDAVAMGIAFVQHDLSRGRDVVRHHLRIARLQLARANRFNVMDDSEAVSKLDQYRAMLAAESNLPAAIKTAAANAFICCVEVLPSNIGFLG
ncbi:MAG: hypothetical protein ACRD3W_10600, partial [Terriglobales bacterium]